MTNVILDLLFVSGWLVFTALVVAERNRVATAASKRSAPDDGETGGPPTGESASLVDLVLWTELDDRQLARLLSESSP